MQPLSGPFLHGHEFSFRPQVEAVIFSVKIFQLGVGVGIKKRLILGLCLSGFLGAAGACALTIDQVPAPVQKTIEKQANGGTFGDIAEGKEGKATIYSTVVSTEGKAFLIAVNSRGKLLHKRAGSLDELIDIAKSDAGLAKLKEHKAKREGKKNQGRDGRTKDKGTAKTPTDSKTAGASNAG